PNPVLPSSFPTRRSSDLDLVGSPDGIDVRLMKATEGRILAKTGADGLLCLSLLQERQGLAIKVLDGGVRALAPATLHILQCLARSEEHTSELQSLRHLVC